MARHDSVWLRIVRTPLGACSAALLVLVLGTAVLAPVLWGDQAAATDIDALSQGPSAAHVLGTDSLGRDILYRLLVATRLSIELTLAATIAGVTLGLLLGLAPFVLGRVPGRFVTAVVNIAVAFPALLLVLFFAVVFGTTTRGAVLALAVAMAPFYARLTQTLAASVAGRDFVAAARVAGAGRFRTLVRHIIPNISGQLIINAMIGAAGNLVAFAGLSFLGIGVQPPQYDWGRTLNEGLPAIYTNPAAALAPAVTVVIAALAFNLFGEATAQVMGVRVPSRRFSGRPHQVPRTEEPDQVSGEPLLAVKNLRVSFPGRDGWTTPVRGVSFSMGAGDAVGIVGESGSGKSVTALAVAKLIERPGSVVADELSFEGNSLLGAADHRQRRMLGTSLAMVFQDPMASLNPAMKIGRQLSEVPVQHQGLDRKRALDKAVRALQAVRIQAAARRVRQYPHQLSGGMRQRVMIAMGLMATPRLIVADEPTTALDVTVQWQVLRQLQEARADQGAGILLISHDISVISRTCDRVLVMYAGRIVEDLPTAAIFTRASHPYTRALLAAVPDIETDREQPLAVIPGRPPEPDQIPAGCAFAARCPAADAVCGSDDPVLISIGDRHRVACWHAHDPEVAG
ncbi:dipeptide/oligopeptide/nickel ABC transporter permease/ATP-binding protein [Kribbella solani]|uniref:Oligopeptide/dipeptide ABC transporter ATP-binding protein n=1 Tax=Kribbella solani TaxID=236067 RepID=A0A841DIY1_9ACTN|nr:dipeptide/oligopeptide/nickel ABC transporter permease/ATP-binding protein [Kribbella solani]MBB5977529.1 oligopeptide/dipeptide ABC transporter ATP-binding protein [Kribbella solani]